MSAEDSSSRFRNPLRIGAQLLWGRAGRDGAFSHGRGSDVLGKIAANPAQRPQTSAITRKSLLYPAPRFSSVRGRSVQFLYVAMSALVQSAGGSMADVWHLKLLGMRAGLHVKAIRYGARRRHKGNDVGCTEAIAPSAVQSEIR